MKTLEFLKEYAYLFLLSIISFVTPIIPFIFIVGVLSSIDLLVAYKVNNILKKEEFSSEKFKGLIVKMSIYGASLLVARSLDYFIMNDKYDGIMIKATLVYLLISELRSLDEKYKKLTGKFLIKEITDFFNNFMRKFKNK